MRRTVAVSLLTVALLLVPAALSSVMRHGGGGHGGGHGFHGHNGFHGHFHGHGVIVAGPWWGPWWGYPPYYYPPYYYPPQVVVQPAPVIVDEQPQSYWYYCTSAKAYYPTAPTCPEVWIKVPPRRQ